MGDSTPSPATHTQLGMVHATPPRLDTQSSHREMSLPSRMPSPPLDQSPLLPMLPHGHHTLVESSTAPAVTPTVLTTVSPWSVTIQLRTTGSSGTPGEAAGESLVT